MRRRVAQASRVLAVVAIVVDAKDASAAAFYRHFVMTYALCGFANLGSLGIMIGGLGTMFPAMHLAALGRSEVGAAPSPR